MSTLELQCDATWLRRLRTGENRERESVKTRMPMKEYHYMTDVLANIFITMMTKFRMVAERIVHLRQGPQHKKQHGAEQKPLLLSQYQVNSALLVKPTYLDPTSRSTTTW
eukprot:5200790-Amphidinium_carterae.3